MSDKTVVILGAGYAGITVAHKLLKTTLPKVSDLKVILVTPSSDFYWNPAAVRAVVPGEMGDDVVFAPIASNFASYSKDSFEFVLGSATSADPASNKVVVELGAGGTREISYGQLVVATGSAMLGADMPFKLLGTAEKTKSALATLRTQIEAASSIVIAGGGSTGVETAGELGEKYASTNKKSVTLVVSGERILDNLLPKISAVAEAALKKLNVKIVYKTRVTGHEGSEAKLSNGESIAADVYLPLFGVRPNTQFLPASLLNSAGEVPVDANLRAKDSQNVWALGDVSDKEVKMLMKAGAQAAAAATNLDVALSGSGSMTAYAPSDKVMMFVTVGKKSGTGQMGTWKFPGFLVSMIKGKTLFAQNIKAQVSGK